MARSVAKVNVFRDGDVWCASVWIDGEFDSSDPINGVDDDCAEEVVFQHERDRLSVKYDVDIRRVEDCDTNAGRFN